MNRLEVAIPLPKTKRELIVRYSRANGAGVSVE